MRVFFIIPRYPLGDRVRTIESNMPILPAAALAKGNTYQDTIFSPRILVISLKNRLSCQAGGNIGVFDFLTRLLDSFLYLF